MKEKEEEEEAEWEEEEQEEGEGEGEGRGGRWDLEGKAVLCCSQFCFACGVCL